MTVTAHEIQRLNHDSGQITDEGSKYVRRVAFEFKDAGSRRAAKVALAHYGVKAGHEQVVDQLNAEGRAFGADGKPTPKLDGELDKVPQRVENLKAAIDHNDWQMHEGSTVNHIDVSAHNATLLHGALSSLAEAPREDLPDDISRYYADLMPHLLKDAGLSVDIDEVHYSV